MNRLALVLIGLCYCSALSAQSASYYQMPGQGFEYGASGRGILWDYTNLPILEGDTLTLSILPTSTEGMTETTSMIFSFGDSAFYHLSKDASKGLVSATRFEDKVRKFTMNYDPSLPFLIPGLPYGESLEESCARTYTLQGTEHSETGKVIIESDANGILMLPGQGYANVSRIKRISHFVNNDPLADTTFESQEITYYWFAKDDPLPVLIYNIQVINRLDRFASPYLETKLICRAPPPGNK